MPLGPEVKTTKAKNPTNRTAPRMKMPANRAPGRRVMGPSGDRGGGLEAGGGVSFGSLKGGSGFGNGRRASRRATLGYPILRERSRFGTGGTRARNETRPSFHRARSARSNT